MKQTNKILSMLAIAGLLFFTGCSDESEENPDPEVAVKTCQLTGLNENSDGEDYDVTFTYDTNGNLTDRTDPDGTIKFVYTDNKLTSLDLDGTISPVSYDGNDLPYRIDFNDDEDEFYFLMKSENGRYVSFESYLVVDEVPILGGSTKLSYDASGNVTSVVTSEYDEDGNSTEEYTVAKDVLYDDKKNPIITSPALMIYELLDGEEVNLGTNNPTSYTAYFGSDVEVANTYEYNEEGYPTKKVQTGFSSDSTVYEFIYKCD